MRLLPLSLMSVLLLLPVLSGHAHDEARAHKEAGADPMAETLKATGAWVREVPAASRHSAGYLVLHNSGSEERSLVAVESPQFQRTMLHRTTEEDGMSRMRHVDTIAIPAGGKTVLEPLGLHIMLMERIPESLSAGDAVGFSLRFDDGSELHLDAVVSREAPDGASHGTSNGPSHGHGQHHGHHDDGHQH